MRYLDFSKEYDFRIPSSHLVISLTRGRMAVIFRTNKRLPFWRRARLERLNRRAIMHPRTTARISK